jgi:hypothetical protein
MIAAGLGAGLLLLTISAEAGITFRAASSARSPGITFVGDARMPTSDNSTTTATNASITPPSGMRADDYVVVYVAARTTATVTNPTTGGQSWTAGTNTQANGLSFRIFHCRFNGTWTANPNFNWTNNVAYQVWMVVFRGVDTTTAIDAGPNIASFAAPASPYDVTIAASTITTVTASAMVIASWHSADNNTWALQTAGWSNPNGQAQWRHGGGSDSSTALAYKEQVTAGGSEAVTNRQTGFNAPDAGIRSILALRPSSASLTIDKPANTVQNDVMVAGIATRPDGLTINPPAGWALAGINANPKNASTTANQLAVYYKVAGAGEPANYTWTFTLGTSTGSAGGIMTFAGVDPDSPIVVENGNTTGSSQSFTTQNVTTGTVANTMVVAHFAFSSSMLFTNNSSMSQPYSARSIPSDSGAGESIAGAYVLQPTAGFTGAKNASVTNYADVGETHILALRPLVCAAVPDASYVAAAAQNGTGNVTVYWASTNPALILRKTAAFGAGDAPTDGAVYAVGDIINGAATVAYNGSVAETSFTATGLSNGTTYYYKVFPKTSTPCYAGGTGAEVSATPQAGPQPAWSYTLAGGSMLKAGIAGEGTVNTSSNASRIISVNTANGTQSWEPLATNQPIQSWLTWLPAKGGISSVQSGTVTMTTTASLDVTISTVTLARSILFFTVQEDNLDPSNGQVRGQLTSSTNLQFNRTGTATTITIKWYVAEFVSGVSVQRGSAALTTSPLNVAINSVDLGKTFVLASWQKPGATYGSDDFLRARLTSSTNLELTAGSTDGTADWQVVSMASASVQSGDLSFLSTDSSKTATIGSVDTTKSFLIASWVTDGDGIGANFVRGRITSATQLTFDRGATGRVLNLTWFLVTLTDDSTVQSGNASFGTAVTQINVSSLTPVTLTRSVAFLSGSQRGGSTPFAGLSPSDNPGVGWFTADLTSTTNLRLTRGTNQSASAEAAWFVVEFAQSTGPATVIGGDQSGRVYLVDAYTGATTWTADLSASADFIQATPAAHLLSYANAAFLAAYTDDVIFVASRNAGATNCGTSSTNNKVFALRASDGAVLWTFNGTCTSAVDWIVGMPYVDYGRNRLYVTSRAGATGTQTSLWVIDTVTGALVTPPSPLTLGHLDASPTLSADGNTIYVASWNGTSGTLYAVNANTLATKWSLGLGAAGNVKSFMWEDPGNPGRLYFSNGTDVRCVQDSGASGSACAGWTPPVVAGASTLLLLDKIYVGSSDGKVHQIDPSNGVDEKQFPAATTLDGTQVGDVSTESSTELFVGTAAGKLYKIPLPLP